jgi:hypothetical protein
MRMPFFSFLARSAMIDPIGAHRQFGTHGFRDSLSDDHARKGVENRHGENKTDPRR